MPRGTVAPSASVEAQPGRDQWLPPRERTSTLNVPASSSGGGRRGSNARDSRVADVCAAQLLGVTVDSHESSADSGTISEADVRAKLEDGREQGKRLHRLIQRPTLLVGLSALVAATISFAVLFGTENGGVPPLIAVPVSFLLLLALLPTDRRSIFGLCIALSVLSAVFAAVFADILTRRVRAYESGACYARRDGTNVPAPCLFTLGTVMSAAGFTLGLSVFCARVAACVLVRSPARVALQLVWMSWGLMMLVLAASNGVRICTSVIAGVWWFDASNVHIVVFTCEFVLLGPLALRADFRLRAQSWLASRGEAVTTAASIAALIGSRSAEEVQQLALQRLRAIRLDLISYDELTSPKPDPLLFEKSSRCQLGQIDAFISHSWRDEPEAKWQALQAWRAGFKARFHREPIVWLDKACIEQDDIDANLMCLPVFLAGCNTLLVLFSRSYLERLWCVTEIFIFMQMGGTADRIEMILPDHALGAPAAGDVSAKASPFDVHDAIKSFDVQRAACFRSEERERLLTVIEAGFGGLGVFNEVLVKLLDAAVALRDAAEARALAAKRGERMRRASGDRRASTDWTSGNECSVALTASPLRLAAPSSSGAHTHVAVQLGAVSP